MQAEQVFLVYHDYYDFCNVWKNLVCICDTEELAMEKVVELEKANRTKHNVETDNWYWVAQEVLAKSK